MPEISHCPLCHYSNPAFFHQDNRRKYYRCLQCLLVSVPSVYYLDLKAERAEYDKHENNVLDSGYRRFLSRLADPLLACFPPTASGLDFGCGPGPALAAILREAGHTVELYDSYYVPDQSVFLLSYDFVCATEVVEHLHFPGRDLDRLWQVLKPGGTLAVMTKLVRSPAAFANWHYKNDQTHVCFFSVETWQWWAQSKGAKLAFYGEDVMLLEKPL